MEGYAESLLGVPYRWWRAGDLCIGDQPPFYAEAGPPPLAPPTLNCAGFINCLARFVGRPIPGVADGLWYAGGTYAWYEELAHKCAPIASIDELPVGTLLLRRFRDAADQGHLAVVWTNGCIIHCWPDKGVVIEVPPANYFEYYCNDWLGD
jgi:cell wall-associated NlpC family hydrolase